MTMQLFLLSRILMVRLEAASLADALRKLWPHLLAELVSVFDTSQNDRDFLLQIEGIKIVELMSQLNLEDFQMNQWMFLFDGYGMDIQPNVLVAENPGAPLPKVDPDAKDVFQPYLVKFMCNRGQYRTKEDYGGVEPFAAQTFNFYNVATEEARSHAPKKAVQ